MRNSWEGGWGSQKQGSNQDMNTEDKVKPACVYSVKLKRANLLIVKREKKKKSESFKKKKHVRNVIKGFIAHI